MTSCRSSTKRKRERGSAADAQRGMQRHLTLALFALKANSKGGSDIHLVLLLLLLLIGVGHDPWFLAHELVGGDTKLEETSNNALEAGEDVSKD